MSATVVRRGGVGTARVRKVDLRSEEVGVSVSDWERARKFYESLEWRQDAHSAPSAASPG